jgi:hypothetical protein
MDESGEVLLLKLVTETVRMLQRAVVNCHSRLVPRTYTAVRSTIQEEEWLLGELYFHGPER